VSDGYRLLSDSLLLFFASIRVHSRSRFQNPHPGTTQMNIDIHRLEKRFGSFAALQGIDLSIASGELVALLGPSGSGKTTLLRTIAGLEFADRGRILFGDRDASHLSVQARRVGFVFQHYALFRHMSVLENVAFGLRCRPRRERPAAEEIERRARELLQRVQLEDLHARLPDQLSGGQRQRVALARAMAIDPTVLLLDEPFGALDAKVRVELRRWLRRIHDETGYTTVFVTHDQEEALELADRVVVLNEGRIEQVGTPGEVYADPRTPFVFDFLGRSNQLQGQVREGHFLVDGAAHAIALGHDASASGPEDHARLFVRPHDLRVVPVEAGLPARVRQVRRLAGRATLDLEVAGQARGIELDLPDDAALPLPRPGDQFGITAARFRVFAGAAAS
jgi:sulfate transport system ATP-binding protein